MIDLKDIDHGELFVVYGIPLFKMENVNGNMFRCQCMDGHSQQLHEDTKVDKLIDVMQGYYKNKSW